MHKLTPPAEPRRGVPQRGSPHLPKVGLARRASRAPSARNPEGVVSHGSREPLPPAERGRGAPQRGGALPPEGMRMEITLHYAA